MGALKSLRCKTPARGHARFRCMLKNLLVLIGCLSILACSGKSEPGGGTELHLATTTSVQDSGLLTDLARAFEEESGYKIRSSAVGSGRALELLAAGKADVAITHAPDAERKAVRQGLAAKRTPIMHNEFVIVGPATFASIVAGAGDVSEVMKRLASSKLPFVSRADNSGTNKREERLWAIAGIKTEGLEILQSKAGMAASLKLASNKNACTLTDQGTFLANKGKLDLAILFQGDDELRNTYAVMEPPATQKGANHRGAQALREFLRSDKGRSLIGGHGIQTLGEPLFTPEE